MAYTPLATVSTGELWTAADHNTYIKANLLAITTQSIQAAIGYNVTDTSEIPFETFNQYGIPFPDNKACVATAWIRAIGTEPTAYAVVYSGSSGNVYNKLDILAGADGEDYDNIASIGSSYAAEALTGGKYAVVAGETLTGVAEGDFILLNYYRDGTHASDTMSATVLFTGFYLVYG